MKLVLVSLVWSASWLQTLPRPVAQQTKVAVMSVRRLPAIQNAINAAA